MIKYKQGNILDATENIIVQSVNHQGVMGAGLAKQILNKYPKINRPNNMYQLMCKQLEFDEIKLEGLVAWHSAGINKVIGSIFGQDRYGKDKQYTDYVSLGNGLNSVKLLAEIKGWSVAIPSGIACGLGGGDWTVVLNIIENCFLYSPEVPVMIYKYE